MTDDAKKPVNHTLNLADSVKIADSLKISNPIAKFFIAGKETDPSLEVAKNPKEMAELTQGLFQNTGFTTADFKGFVGIEENQKAKWEKKDLTALVGVNDLSLLDLTKKRKIEGQGYLIPIPPKITASQFKNLDTLIVLLERENRRRAKKGEDKGADLEFYFKDYAKLRGYKEQEIERGGNFNNELKRDLISGGITSYILEREKSYLIGSFYTIEVPKVKSKEKWRVWFNEPYKGFILNVKQYYPILLKAIGDRRTEKKGYLYFFLKLVLSRGNNPDTGFATQLKVSTILDRLKISDAIKERPLEAFKMLAECISYVVEFRDVLTEIRILNSKFEVRVVKDLTIFQKPDYQRFKADYLEPIGLDDIRDALLSFNPIRIKEELDNEPKGYLEDNFLPS